ncbi:uncharacterized protein LOC141691520 [Apium graveolens]|uniref:uncharacterized protein LOC141691520 n=1 Tax=Apium graveolens TaxID=4045 RepID=UPI003D7939BE
MVNSDLEREKLKWFMKWVLDIGNDDLLPPQIAHIPCIENHILIPPQFCNLETENMIKNMISITYHGFKRNGHDLEYLSKRVILTPTNQTAGHLNSLIIDMLLGMSPHDLKLKAGAVVMLMRNLNQTLGLCNGTKMIVTKYLRFCVECEVICGTFIGTKHFIPRMELSPPDNKMHFKLVRKQMPLQICYAMTINKSQGQSLDTVGSCLPKSIFTHGQYYVAVNRITSPSELTIFVDDDSDLATNITQNMVFKEVFYALSHI